MPSTPFEDYYEILGLQRGASKAEVSRAYRKLSLEVHPDRYKGPDPDGAVARFLKLTQAKEVLEDDKARAAFDAVVDAKAAHRARQEAQEGGRRKMREELEAREAAAKVAKFAPSAAAAAAREERERESAEAAARAELQREIERLRRTGRLDPTRPAPAAAPAAEAAGGSYSVVLRWQAADAFTEQDLRPLLLAAAGSAAPEAATSIRAAALAVAGRKALLQVPAAVAKALVSSRALADRGLQVSFAGGAAEAAAAAKEAAAHGAAPSGDPPDELPPDKLPEGWRTAIAPDGRPYFYHAPSRRTRWKRPAAGGGGDRLSHEALEVATLERLRRASEAQRQARGGA